MDTSSAISASPRIHRSLRITCVIAVLCSLLLAMSAPFLANSRLEYIGQDFLSRMARHHSQLPAQVKVILVDENTLQYMEPKVGRWPWPRRVYKDIIEFINLGAARAIHFDVLFSERESANNAADDNDDHILVQASADGGNVIHAMQLLQDENNTPPRVPLPPLIANTSRHAATPARDDSDFNDYLAPFSELLGASLGVGIVNAIVDNDGIYRSTRPFFQYHEKLLPALSIAGALALKDARILEQINADNDASNAHLVNYYDQVPAYSLSGILESAAQIQRGDSDPLLVNPEEFKDSYVFIGASAIGLHDLKATPLSALTPGVFVHAAYLGNLLSNDLLQVANPALLYLVLPLLAFTVAFTVIFSRHLSLQLGAPLLIALAYLVLAYLLRRHNLQIALATPVLGIILSSMSAFAYLFSVEERERKQVRAMFSRYVSPAALNVLLSQVENARSAALGSREVITVLFCDMRGFTTLSESMPAEDIVRILNHYFTVMTDIIFRHAGTVDKFIGDAIMATWGAPLPSQSHALDAVRCAQSMQAALPDINLYLQQQGLPPINIGIGIHSGEAIMGSLGSQQKADFTVIGDSVNMASRLEGVCKIYQRIVVISEDTWREVHTQIDCQLLDCIKVKGKHVAVKIFSPLGDLHHTGNLDNRRIVVASQQAFDLYSQQQWSACLALLENLPAPAKLTHLEQRCHDYMKDSPEPDWQAVYTLQNK